MLSSGSNSSCNVIVAQSFLTTPAKFWIDSTGAGPWATVDIDSGRERQIWILAIRTRRRGNAWHRRGLLIFEMILTASPYWATASHRLDAVHDGKPVRPEAIHPL